jgi:hypothetical protein
VSHWKRRRALSRRCTLKFGFAGPPVKRTS